MSSTVRKRGPEKVIAAASWSTWRSSIGVSTASGQITVTATPCGRSSWAAASEKPRTAYFEAEYRAMPGTGASAAREAMLMM